MLLALFDPEHIHHVRALAWWSANRADGWASCPLTQNGFVRVISGVRYPRPRRVVDAMTLISAQTAEPGHVFWSDNIAIVDNEFFDRSRILGPKQITDAYLLGLAVKNGGRLVTLDRGVSTRTVRSAEERHVVTL